MRVQRDTGKVEVIFDEAHAGLWGWSPDGTWAYYYDKHSIFTRIRIDLTGQPTRVVPDMTIYSLTWTPPYQAEWQPAYTLILGIGLMSFSTLLSTLHWIRRQRIASPVHISWTLGS